MCRGLNYYPLQNHTEDRSQEIAYPNQITETLINLVCMDYKTIKEWAYILHDKDINEKGELKKPHFHIYLNLNTMQIYKKNHFHFPYVSEDQLVAFALGENKFRFMKVKLFV